MTFAKFKIGLLARCLLVIFPLYIGLPTEVSAQATAQQIYLQCLTNFENYAETIWVNASGSSYPTNAGYWGDGGSTGNGGIRGSAGIAVMYATLVVAQPGDARNANRISRITKALNYAAQAHVSGSKVCVDGSHWGWSSGTLASCTSQSGADWQSAEWSGSLGLACVLVQSSLPAQTIADCQTVVASEANHRAGIAPCTRTLTDGDTKAEENAWDSNILSLGAAWMTNNANAALWLFMAKQYLANSYTVANTNGDSLASWVTTTTLFPSYALENHGFYHPTYQMVAGMSLGDSLLMARMANTNIAAQLQPFAEHNVLAVWSNNMSFVTMESGETAYPSSVDWSLHDYEHNSYLAWMATHFNDPVARYADARLAQLVLYRQQVNGDGRFVGAALSGGFYREAVEARRTAIAWLHHQFEDYPTGTSSAPGAAIGNFSDVGILTQRSTNGFVGISYGARIMGYIESTAPALPTNTFASTPMLGGIFGHGPLGIATSASLTSLVTNASGFTLELLVVNGANGSTRIAIKSIGESVAIVEVPLPATGVNGTTAGCFTNGIQNDPLTGNTRLIEWTGGSTNLASFSGTTVNITNNWVCISGHHGMAAGPGGFFRYKAATAYDGTMNAAQDLLHVMPQSLLGPRYAVWFLGKNAAQTAILASQISWTTNGSTVSLAFPGSTGTTNILTTALTGSGTWSADASGNWNDIAKWAGGTVADGAGLTADFSTVNIAADRTVTLDSAHTIGTLKFGDATGAQNWILNSTNSNALTLSASAPAIIVTNTATISAPLAGTVGFTKSGPGTLILSGSNSLAGTFNVDTANTANNDGIVRVANPFAVTNIASPINILDNNSGHSTLQLDGTQGNIFIPQAVNLAGRNASFISIQNISGSNTLAGGFIFTSGGGNYWFDSDAGTLNLSGLIPSSAPSVPNARTLTFMGAGNFVVSGIISNANSFAVSLVKSNAGSLLLNGVNTFTGSTTISGGTLGGSGTIAGPVTILAGGNLSPGDNSLGALTINNTLTNYGTLSIRLNRSGATLTNDTIRGVTTLAYSGTLQLVPSGDPITVSNSFKNFYASSYKNYFTNIIPATPGTNLLWNTNSLATSGTLAVALGTVTPQVGQIFLAGTNLVFSGSGGAAGYYFSIVAATNLTTAVTNWPVVGSGVCDASGNFIVTNSLSATTPARFYAIRIP